MSKAAVSRSEEATKELGCRHHWLIDSPQGPISMGICKLCGAQKEFRNSGSDFLWEGDPLSELSQGRWGKSRDFHAPTDKSSADDLSTAGTGAAGSTRLV